VGLAAALDELPGLPEDDQIADELEHEGFPVVIGGSTLTGRSGSPAIAFAIRRRPHEIVPKSRLAR
jgi:hypothetical protein